MLHPSSDRPAIASGGHARGVCDRPGKGAGALLALLLLPAATGCYTYAAVGTSPLAPSSEVTFAVTDRGRLALSETVGPGALRVAGRVVETTDTALVLGVTWVKHIDLGVPVQWRGERVVVSREHIADLREKRFSRGRSITLGAVVAAGLAATSLIAIEGFGTDPGDTKPGGGEPPQSSRILPIIKYSLIRF